MRRVDTATEFSRRRLFAGAAVVATGLALPTVLGSTAQRFVPAVPASPHTFFDPHKPRLLPRALAALDTHGDRIRNRDLIGVVDFAEPSRVPRFHLIDLGNGHVTTHLVAHGKGSDPSHSGWVQRLSNQPDSNASSRGAFVTAEAYVGKHGQSRRLQGLDPENSMAESRGIVIHAATYVNKALAASKGVIGRSQGCFAVADDVIGEVLERLGPGRLILSWK
jgi:hypothetical protein